MSILVDIYHNNIKQKLSDYDTIDSKVYVSKFQGLSLEEYVSVKKYLCDSNHPKLTCDCNAFINLSQAILSNGICCLSNLFKVCFPNVTYKSFSARRKVLHIPCVVFPVCNQLYIMEKVDGLNYVHLSEFLTSKLTAAQAKQGMTKDDLQNLLLIASSDKERECIKYAVYKSSGYTPTRARREYGLDNMANRASKVESSISDSIEIMHAYDDLLEIQERTLVDCYGKDEIIDDTADLSDESSEENSVTDGSQGDEDSMAVSLSKSALLDILIQSEYNWFTFIEQLHEMNYNVSDADLEDFISSLPMNLDKRELAVQSHRAYVASKIDFKENERISRCINGEVVTDTDSDECDISSKTIKEKKIKLRRKIRRLKAQAIAESRFLSRKVTKKTSKLLKDFPNIGEIVEDFVRDHNVGADSWRRTGVLTFDGNVHIKEKVTYSKIQKHLESKLGRSVSYGTTVELCIPRNRRRRSAKRYQGVAQVTTRRARKGFNLRYNPDKHWSAAWYKGLNNLHYEDGLKVLNLNRDDAAGFRLDTLTTCKQYSTPTVQGSAILTTRTDYVNRYNSTLQTTSYNFTKTKNTGEVCLGIVKAVPIHSKNPAQHYSDLLMLANLPELNPVFFDTTSSK